MAYFDINKIRVRFLIKYPYFASTLDKLEIVMDSSEATAATDGEKLFFSPEFMNSLNEEQQLFTFAHEVLHVAFDHINRSEGKNHYNWNIATDAVINAYLSGDGLDQPPGTVDIAEAINYCAEQIYNRLQEKDKEKQETKFVDAQDSGKHGSGEEISSNNSSSDNQENNNSDKEKGDKSSASSDEKDEKNDDNVGHDSHSRWEEAAKRHNAEKEKNGQSDGNDENAIDEREEFHNNKSQKEKNDDEYLNFGKTSYSHGVGEMSSSSRRNPTGYDQIQATNIDWRMLLKENAKIEYDWDMVDPEIENGVVVPTFNPQPSSQTEIVIDSSASISETLIKNFLKECMSILKCSFTEVGFFDTCFYGFEPVRGEDDINHLTIKGGGATDFNAAVNAFTNRAENKIIFTDGKCTDPEQYCDAIWVVVGYHQHKINPPGGKVIYITGEEYERLNSPSYSYQK